MKHDYAPEDVIKIQQQNEFDEMLQILIRLEYSLRIALGQLPFDSLGQSDLSDAGLLIEKLQGIKK